MPKKDFLVIIILTIFFSLIIFFIKTYFFESSSKQAEEIYIDRSLFLQIEPDISLESTKIATNEELNNNSSFVNSKTLDNNVFETISAVKEKEIIKLNPFYFTYIPDNFSNDVSLQTFILRKILSSTSINDKVIDLTVELNKIMYDVRWKMKWWVIKLFWIKNYENEEIVSVFIHEFAHHLDIYYLDSSVFNNIDPSKYFYDISWESTKVIKSWLTWSDFVSGYSMTNKYEDFAESFTYFVLHNNSFKEKAKKSDILKQKYNYFSDYIFKNREFQQSSFSSKTTISDYYRDITKIDIKLENFLQYLQKSI